MDAMRGFWILWRYWSLPTVPVERHFWHRQPPVDAAVTSFVAKTLAQAGKVIDVGAGYDPWPRATELVDIRRWSDTETRPVHLVDIESDRLPFADQSVDFAYTRHTLEDIHSPWLLCREMNRVARAGYIETPSPASEFCRGVDGGKPPYRGYIHHRWFIWEENGTLLFLPKYPIVEYVQVDEAGESRLTERLNSQPIIWNTYFPWSGSFKFHVLRHDVDFDLRKDYGVVIMRAISKSIENARRFAETHQVDETGFVPTR
jgi:hypothetical protein